MPHITAKKFLQKTANKVIFYGIIAVVLIFSTVLIVYFGIDQTPQTVEISSPLSLEIASGTYNIEFIMVDTGRYTAKIKTNLSIYRWYSCFKFFTN